MQIRVNGRAVEVDADSRDIQVRELLDLFGRDPSAFFVIEMLGLGRTRVFRNPDEHIRLTEGQAFSVLPKYKITGGVERSKANV